MTGKKTVELILAAALLGYLPSTFAGERASYPTERVATFIVDNLDVASLPSLFQIKKEKGKKTFADYRYTTLKLEEKKALVAPASGGPALSISILDETPSGIYACVATLAQDDSTPTVQNVIFMKRKESNALLKVRDSWREFASCRSIGTSEDFFPTQYGG